VRSGKAGQEQRHARDVAVVFTGLIRAAEVDVVDRFPIDARIAFPQRPQHVRAEIVGPNPGERPAELADRRAYAVAEKCFVAVGIHLFVLSRHTTRALLAGRIYQAV
jgi:hypothetical protein